MIYYIDGHNFKEYGIYVAGSNGVIDGLSLKEPEKYDWPDYHGEQVDLSAKRYKSREITLDCWMLVSSNTDMIQKANSFFIQLSKPGTRRLMIDTGEGKPLVYEVYWLEGIKIDKKWRAGENIGTFALKLVEPDPVKKVLKWRGAGTVSITVNTPKSLTFFWGDGSQTLNVIGSKTITHTYSNNSIYYIVIAGVIDEIVSITTTAETEWSII
jgi:hypothetical protein